MIFIVGGNSQGKLDFALSLLGIGKDDVSDGGSCDFPSAFEKPVLDKLHLLVGRLVRSGVDPLEFALRGILVNPGITVICDEIGSGIVPVGKEDRQLRETVGTVQCELARRADRVYRVYCSIPTLIKGG
ncbi:MAG: bifunctional adenosylcobinamide kinase/adenosylcobinamide-phosphate guanylyltransferase [Oligoflexales bacterium]|nr:bifunctional adenosylcobinamide kinase/adenosylcobinamide-phosphate guanylyltransferase [Oligoflexales bacterium]